MSFGFMDGYRSLWPSAKLLLPLFALLILKVVFSAVYNVFFHPLRHVPGPRMAGLSSLWISRQRGNFQLAHAIKQAHSTYGPVIRIAPNELHFASASALKQIYAYGRDGPKKGPFYKAGKMVKHDNLFSFINKEHYAARKKIVSKCFSQHHLMQFLVGVRSLVDQLGDQIAKSSTENKGCVDLYEWMEWFTFEAMFVMCFNEDAGIMRTGKTHPVLTDMELSKRTVPLNAAFPPLRKFGHALPIASIADPYKATLRWKDFTVKKLQEARLQPNKTSFLARLVDTEDEALGRRLDDDEAAEEIMGLIFAGTGTTAMTMVYLLYELAKLPDFQTKLYEEILAAMTSTNGGPEYKDVINLPLLQALINETLRRHPAIVGVLPREAVVDMVIDSTAIPKGTQIGMSNFTHQMNASIYASPETFSPERWLVPETQTETLKSAYSPFSLGPRNCIGQNYSLAEMQILVATLVLRFTFALTGRMKSADMAPLDFFNAEPRARMLELVVKERGRKH